MYTPPLKEAIARIRARTAAPAVWLVVRHSTQILLIFLDEALGHRNDSLQLLEARQQAAMVMRSATVAALCKKLLDFQKVTGDVPDDGVDMRARNLQAGIPDLRRWGPRARR